MIVAVDGPVAAGKGTLARRIADHYGFAYLDTGALYRATALRLLRAGGDPDDEAAAAAAAAGLAGADLADPALRDEDVGAAASRVAAFAAVRAALLDYQRRFAADPPDGAAGAVLDGRDIGTVVCPDADAKLFVTAAREARARRRHRELEERGIAVPFSQVLADLEERDRRDASRAEAPLKPAADAHLLDTTNLDIDSAFQAARAYLDDRFACLRGRPGTTSRRHPSSVEPAPSALSADGAPTAGARPKPTGPVEGTATRLNRMTETTVAADEPSPPIEEDFAALLDESYGTGTNLEGTVVAGTVIAIESDLAVIDVGLKSEGRVPLREFAAPGQAPEIKVGDKVEVFLDRIENARGEAVLSRDRARREEAWTQLEKAFEKNEKVEGLIFGRVKGGFTVDLSGAVAFLPGSQVDIRPVRDITPLMGIPQPFQILKMDRRRGNIVVSRRAILEETRAADRAELVASLKEGQVIEGVVKNITDYGAFVDLGGVDGLLHVTDIAWRRVNHPTEALNVGQTVKVQVIRINTETQRISLGMKQLEADPWDGVEAKYPVATKFMGRVTNITDYGAFVELEPGVEGLVHVSEMSWTKKNVHPGKIVSTSQMVEVMVLDVDPVKRRVSLGLKQCLENPWQAFAESHPPGSVIEGDIKNITEFGLFVGLEGGVDGMVHLSDISWSRPGEEALADYKKGDTVKAIVLDVDVERERISLGIKQLSDDPFAAAGRLKRGSVVTCTVTKVLDNGIEVTIGDGLTAFIRRSDLARDRSEQRPDRFAVGDKVDARITNIDIKARRVSVSIKAREIAEEKEAVATYGSTDSGASLGEILGPAMGRARAARQANQEDEAPTEEPTEEPTGEPEAKPKAKSKAKAKKDAEKAGEAKAEQEAAPEGEAETEPEPEAQADAADPAEETEAPAAEAASDEQSSEKDEGAGA